MPRAVKEWIGKTPDTRPPPRVLLRILERENHTCHISGRKIAPGEPWQAEHKIAIINGGENRETNLFPALTDPHKAKTKLDLAEKSKVAAKAKKHFIGKPEPVKKLQSAGFRQSQQAIDRAARQPKTMPPRRSIYED